MTRAACGFATSAEDPAFDRSRLLACLLAGDMFMENLAFVRLSPASRSAQKAFPTQHALHML